MMTGKQLKNAILQLAIQGKLVPQDANDEPASVLLAQIRKEKEQLLKAGKLKKKDLETTPITDEEKPFEIPESWEWCRIGTIFIHASGKQQSSSNKSGGTPQKFITTSNLYWNRFELDNVKVMNFTKEEMQTCSATKGDLLVCEGGAGYGRSAIWPYDYDICLQNHIHRLRPYISGICEYVYYIIYLLKESNRLASVGTAMPGLSANRLKELLIPLPPLAEQHRIVSKIEELMPLVEEYGAAQEKLNRLNEALPEALKKSILQQAIQGKLVPQDANDEPASALLAQIRKEKEQLVKAGKLKKKDLETTPIADDEKPFEIPESWEWVNIPMIGNSQLGKTKNPNQRAGKMFPYLCSINVYWEGIRMDTLKEMLFTESEQEKYRIEKGDLVVCEGGDCGRTSIWEKEETVLYQNALHRVRFYQGINPYYIQYCMFLYCNNGLINEYKKGETIQHLVKNKLDAIPFPLPPLAEQRRIVAKIEELLEMVEGMK